MELVINIVDYLILVKYFRELQGKPRYQNRVCWVLYSVVAVAGITWTNSLGVPIINIISGIVYILATGMWFEGRTRNRILMALFYWGLCMGSDVLAVFFFKLLSQTEMDVVSLVLLKVLYVLIIYFMVNIFCSMKREAQRELPAGTTAILALVLFICVLGCILLNAGGSTRNFNYTGIILLLSVFALIHFMLFLLMEKMNKMMRLNYEQEMLLQEVNWKEAHFKELEEVNQKILRIRHDMKNRLNAICELDDLEKMKESIRLALGEIVPQNERIYTGNQIVNGICKVKFEMAEQNQIKVEQKIEIPAKLQMESGEIGILLGNILDNAIEACQKAEEKYLHLIMETKGCNLFILLENSKSRSKKGGIGKTSKENKKGHGYGMISVRNIVEKYNGVLRTEDRGEKYITEMILYHVLCT
ncbi:MAG: GHKL domain-containing protein [Clostridiales bacterium]|nr:GHKL domain-containing protein [Clostridiales bacterium]